MCSTVDTNADERYSRPLIGKHTVFGEVIEGTEFSAGYRDCISAMAHRADVQVAKCGVI